ncbi:tetratricopeptide repeat protein [Pseudoalteromonas espejiana]
MANSILRFLLKNGDSSLTYQSGATLTASQTYANLNANCLSLSILAYSLADYLGIKARFQKVHIPEYWAINKGVNLLTGHINLSIDNEPRQNIPATMVYQRDKYLTIDFDPNIRKQRFKTSLLSKEVVTAMFYNNKGALALVNKQYNLAFSYFSAAVKVAPSFSGGWGNLGIVFRQLNYLNEAELAYNYAIALDKNNHTALGNLAVLYTLSNRQQKGQQILKQLDTKRRLNPYYHVSLGNSELALKNYTLALKHFKTAYNLDSHLHESHFGLARAYYLTGNITLAKNTCN